MQPPAPILSPLPLLLPSPLSHLPAYTLFRLSTALPFRVQSFYINDLDALPHSLRMSFVHYFQLYITPAVVASPVSELNRRLQELGMDDASVSCDGTRVVLAIHTGVTELRICYDHADLYPLDITTVGVRARRDV